MNIVMEHLLSRRSIRAFEEKEIPRHKLEQILEAARYAPSGMNRQSNYRGLRAAFQNITQIQKSSEISFFPKVRYIFFLLRNNPFHCFLL